MYDVSIISQHQKKLAEQEKAKQEQVEAEKKAEKEDETR